MTQKALLIKENGSTCFEGYAFLEQRNLTADFHNTGASALAAYRTGNYRYVLVSMTMQRDDPLEIIRSIRCLELELGLPPARIVVSAPERQPTQTEIQQYNICGVVRAHRMS